jgi:hypothetical protein
LHFLIIATAGFFIAFFVLTIDIITQLPGSQTPLLDKEFYFTNEELKDKKFILLNLMLNLFGATITFDFLMILKWIGKKVGLKKPDTSL